jgi:hypothetical protein
MSFRALFVPILAIALFTADGVEQTSPGTRPPATLVASFDGIGAGFQGPQGPYEGRNPSDNSLAVGPRHVVQTVNSRLAIFTKQGQPIYGPVPTNTVFAGLGGVCDARNNGDAVVRYDQLADRWLVVMPIFTRVPPELARAGQPEPAAGQPAPPGQLATSGHAASPGPAVALPSNPPPPPAPPQRGAGAGRGQQPQQGTYAICYAVSVGTDPHGPYHRYAFDRPLFPDYPRPAVWPDGYYVATSTGDDRISDTIATQKHACIVERTKMLKGEPAREQCLIIENVNFLNNADLDGKRLPPPGAPNIMMAAGGMQLDKIYDASTIDAWQVHVDWTTPSNTRAIGPTKIGVAPYHYLCDGQLTNCVPQPGADRRLDAQGDKIMARLVYRNLGSYESIVAVHSVNTVAGGGGVRWYEFRVDKSRTVRLSQQGTYAPDGLYRWMASPAIDRRGNIGIGYSFGGAPSFAGQRFAGRLANDPRGLLTLGEAVLADGEAAQTTTMRWEDYSQTAMDPSDDCTIWYVGDYLKRGSTTYSTRIGAFRLPGCR